MEEDVIIKKLGQNVANLRRRRGLSQEELGFLIKKSTNTISNIERGICSGKLETFIELAVALHVDIADLFDFSKNDKLSLSARKKLDAIIEILSNQDSDFIEHFFNHLRFIISQK